MWHFDFICFLKIVNFIKNIKNIFLRKKKATEVINFCFSKPDKETLISQKTFFIDLKDFIDQKENIT